MGGSRFFLAGGIQRKRTMDYKEKADVGVRKEVCGEFMGGSSCRTAGNAQRRTRLKKEKGNSVARKKRGLDDG